MILAGGQEHSHNYVATLIVSFCKLAIKTSKSGRSGAKGLPRLFAENVLRRANIARRPCVFWVRASICTVVKESVISNDAGARWPGNRLQPGRSGFDSHRRLWRRSSPKLAARTFRQATGLVRPAARLPRLRTVGMARSAQGFGTGAGSGRGSSEVEHQAHNLGDTGSTPVHATRGGPNRPLRDAENVSTTGPEGTGRRIGQPPFELTCPRDATAARVHRERTP